MIPAAQSSDRARGGDAGPARRWSGTPLVRQARRFGRGPPMAEICAPGYAAFIFQAHV